MGNNRIGPTPRDPFGAMATAHSPQKPFLLAGPDHKALERRSALTERMAKDLVAHAVWQDQAEAVRLLLWLGYHPADITLLVVDPPHEAVHEAMLMEMMRAVGEAL